MLTYLLASNEVSITSTATACLFFDYIGDSIQDIQRLKFIHTTTDPNDRPGRTPVKDSKKWQEADLFKFLEKARSLRSLKIIVRRWELVLDCAAVQERERRFLKELRRLLEESTGIEFRWRMESTVKTRRRTIQQEWKAALVDMGKEDYLSM